MNIFPYENFYITTKLKPIEVQNRLQEAVRPDSGYVISFRGSYPAGANSPFKGYAINGVFGFKPNIIYRNAFLPQIKGSTEPHGEGSRIHIKMTLYVFVWIAFAGL